MSESGYPWRPADRPWTAQAACVGADPDTFYPDKGGRVEPAKAICAGCPVQRECLDYALEHNETDGVWGGMSANGRQMLQGYRRPAPPVEFRHGTAASYKNHVCRCELCTAANAAYQRDYHRRRKGLA